MCSFLLLEVEAYTYCQTFNRGEASGLSRLTGFVPFFLVSLRHGLLARDWLIVHHKSCIYICKSGFLSQDETFCLPAGCV